MEWSRGGAGAAVVPGVTEQPATRVLQPRAPARWEKLRFGEADVIVAATSLNNDCSEFADGTGEAPWLPCNAALCWLLRNWPSAQVLELCCGQAVPSIYAALAGHSSVTCSDAHEAVLAGADLNARASAARTVARVLKVGDVSAAAALSQTRGPFTLILSSEPWWHRAYDPGLSIFSQARALFSTAAACLAWGSSGAEAGIDGGAGERQPEREATDVISDASGQHTAPAHFPPPSPPPAAEAAAPSRPPIVAVAYTERSVSMAATVERACADCGLVGRHVAGLAIKSSAHAPAVPPHSSTSADTSSAAAASAVEPSHTSPLTRLIAAWAHLDGQEEEELLWPQEQGYAAAAAEQTLDETGGEDRRPGMAAPGGSSGSSSTTMCACGRALFPASPAPCPCRLPLRVGLGRVLSLASPWADVRLFLAGWSAEDVEAVLREEGLVAAPLSTEAGDEADAAGAQQPHSNASAASAAAPSNPLWKRDRKAAAARGTAAAPAPASASAV